MGYRSIVIASDAKLYIKNSQLIIEGEVNGNIPIKDIRTLMIESRSVLITSYTLTALSESGVCVYICDDKHMPCTVLQPFGRYFKQRKRVFTQIEQSKPKLKRLWQSIVISKIKNQAKCLEICGIDIENTNKLLRMCNMVQSGDPTNIEGQAAALYFKSLFGNNFTRNDNSDINAALNYGYAIVRGYISRILADCGFEPCIGIHHRNDLNNFNLSDDMIEPFRPLVDLFVYNNSDEKLSPSKKRELCNILNYEMISGGEHHSCAYSIERMIHSMERVMESESTDNKLLLPEIESLKRHEYE